ncbi:MAG: hypothetical protein FWH32_03620 [Clostridiales bacterium]|nr:hypothetical protein [Clostridiales bacterium]
MTDKKTKRQRRALAQTALIGPPYFTAYLITIIIVLVATAIGITHARMLEVQDGDRVSWFIAVLHWFGTIIPGLFLAFGITTFVFAVIERVMRTGSRKNQSDDEE